MADDTRSPTVYLIHFARPICDGHPTQHYLGWTDNLPARLTAHQRSQGARLVAVANERNIPWECVRTWPGDRARERQIKNWKMSPRLCPICRMARTRSGSSE